MTENMQTKLEKANIDRESETNALKEAWRRAPSERNCKRSYQCSWRKMRNKTGDGGGKDKNVKNV